MKAAVYKRQNEMAVIDVPQPTAGPGEVVLKVHDCGICGSDLHAVQYGFGMPPDSVMGHEFCGEIVEIGPRINGYAIGDRVTSLPYIGCNTCEQCIAGHGMHCEYIRGLGLGQLPGAYAEYVMCGAKSLFKLAERRQFVPTRHAGDNGYRAGHSGLGQGGRLRERKLIQAARSGSGVRLWRRPGSR
jgi:threonine dehydrogenase-like Zn-dependent dehydrogenase